METRKYPLSDDMIDLTAKALDELALRYEIEAAGLAVLDSGDAKQRGAELVKQAAAFRKASDYFLNL